MQGARKLWSSHVAEAQRILGEAASEGADVTDEALLARAEATKEALVGVLLKLATQDPVTIKRFMASNAATGEEVSMDQATEQETVWGQRLPSLRLSDPQLFLAVSFRATYLSSLLEIHRERRRIQVRRRMLGSRICMGSGETQGDSSQVRCWEWIDWWIFRVRAGAIRRGMVLRECHINPLLACLWLSPAMPPREFRPSALWCALVR